MTAFIFVSGRRCPQHMPIVVRQGTTNNFAEVSVSSPQLRKVDITVKLTPSQLRQAASDMLDAALRTEMQAAKT